MTASRHSHKRPESHPIAAIAHIAALAALLVAILLQHSLVAAQDPADAAPAPPTQTPTAQTAAAPAGQTATPTEQAAASPAKSTGAAAEKKKEDQLLLPFSVSQTPWEYRPYKVLIWVASDSNDSADTLRDDLLDFLDRDFFTLWRTTITQAPNKIRARMLRDLPSLDYAALTANDPVIAIHDNHKQAGRVRRVGDVPKYLKKIAIQPEMQQLISDRTPKHALEAMQSLSAVYNTDVAGTLQMRDTWSSEEIDGMVLPRGLAKDLENPDPKIISPPITGNMTDAFEGYDKVFFLSISSDRGLRQIQVVEMDVLMRFFGPTVSRTVSTTQMMVPSICDAIKDAFAAIIRIEETDVEFKETKERGMVVGRVRGGGLIEDPNSPAAFGEHDVLLPAVRKNDRTGKPTQIGVMDWSYLVSTGTLDGSRLKMKLYSGRPGSLSIRVNNRTFRTGLKVRQVLDSSTVRLHAKNRPDKPLIGYELYEKRLDSKKMTFLGRTDWDGRIVVDQRDPTPEFPTALRLLYVKNGQAVLARLPVVPGANEMDVAEMQGDDLRLEAEAYVKGIQNSIVDIIAIRTLLAARIRLRLERGQVKDARELLTKLRGVESRKTLSDDLENNHTKFNTMFDQLRDRNSKSKVNSMFKVTRKLMGEHISDALLETLDGEIIAAERNGGVAPKKTEE